MYLILSFDILKEGIGMIYSCEVCFHELPEKDAVCPDCGKMLFKHKNIFSGKVSGERSVKLMCSDMFVTENRVAAFDSTGRMYASLGGMAGQLAYSSQKKQYVFNMTWDDVEKVVWPLKEKYGPFFNNAHGESGMLIVLKNGDRFALRGSKKITPQLVDFFRNHNITVEQ